MTDTEESSDKTVPDIQKTVRLWPALVFMLIGLGISLSVSQFGSTNNHNLIGLLLAPMGASLLIILWWLVASRVNGRDRLRGFALFGILLTVYMLPSKPIRLP